VLNVPATFGLLILADPVVELLFERGRFLATDTAATAAAVRLYAVGLVGYASTRIVSPIFYTLGRSRVPVVVSVCTIGLNIVLNVTLVRIMGFRGLALGTSLAMLLNGGVLVLLLRRALHGIEGVRLMATFAKTLAAAVAMAVAASLVDHLMAALIPGDAAAIRALRVASAIGGALLVLALGARLLRISEFDEARRTIVRRLLARSPV
jgi:putative peptidoglycan lipid II flippase